MKSLLDMGVSVPDILLPHNIDTLTWASIACDQHTSDREYWRKADETAGSAPSTLRLMLPEAYLGDEGKEERIKSICSAQKEYIKKDIFDKYHGFVYVERKAEGRTRRGLVAAVDLEKYDWHPETRALIRATEATIPERIPPRMKIRRNAVLDMPHIMLLVNDKDHLLTEGVGEYVHKKGIAPLYDGELMLGGGHITGFLVEKEGEEIAAKALNALYEQSKQADGSRFLFAAGDGNHSLATAKAIWDEAKASIPPKERAISLKRYALVEIVNLYDAGLAFKPIHRVLFNADAIDFLASLVAALGSTIKEAMTAEDLKQKVRSGGQFGIVTAGRYAVLSLPDDNVLPAARIQDVIDDYIRSKPNVKVDYIHGDDDAIRLGQDKDDVGILLPPFAKDGLFQTVADKGSLPRKCFSMGETNEKRYYMECRRLS